MPTYRLRLKAKTLSLALLSVTAGVLNAWATQPSVVVKEETAIVRMALAQGKHEKGFHVVVRVNDGYVQVWTGHEAVR